MRHCGCSDFDQNDQLLRKGIFMSSLTVQIRHMERVSHQELLLSMLSAAFGIAGCAALFIPCFPHIREPWFFYAVCGILLSSLFCVLHTAGWGKYLVVSVSILVLLLFFIFSGAFRNGLFLMANDFLIFLTGKTGRIHPYFRTDGTAGVHLVTAIYLTLGSMIASSESCRKRLYSFMLLLACSAVSAVGGFPSSSWALPLCLAALLVRLAVPRRHAAVLRSSRAGWAALLLPLFFAFVLAAAACGCTALLTESRSAGTGAAAEAILRRLHAFRFEPAEKNCMPEGRLLRYMPPGSAEAPMLRVSVSRPEKLYLRGFTGDSYENSVWSGLRSDQNIAFAPLFSTLHENGFYGQAMIASAAEASREARTEEFSLRIVPAGACRQYRYLPYGLIRSGILDPAYIGDAGAPYAWQDPESGQEILVSCLSGSLPEWYALSLSIAGELTSADPSDPEDSPDAAARFLRLEQAYYDYAMQTDRQLSEGAALICGEVFGTKPESRTLPEILDLVRQTLADGFRYEENPAFSGTGAGSEGATDVLAEFLTARYGASVHYATAAAVMLRYLGVPARYVEGYLLTAEEASAVPAGEEITLTSAHAHAWAEFYLRGIGWVPFESAPGFIDSDELDRVLSLAEKAERGAGGSPLFAQAELRYVSGIHNPEPETHEKPLPLRWKLSYLQFVLPVLAGFLTALLLLIFLRRQDAYHQAMQTIRNARTAGKYARAIALEYGYASFLLKKAGIPAPPGLERMQQLNREARFSSHSLSAEDLQEAEQYTSEILRLCRGKWSLRERLYYRWFRRII